MAHGKCSVCPTVGKLTRGWCTKHYQRWKAHGDPLWEPPPKDPARYDSSGHMLHERTCPGCGETCMLRPDQTHCSISCASSSRPHVIPSGEGSPHWAGEAVGYSGMHQRVYRERGRANVPGNRCIHGCDSEVYDWASLIDEPKGVWDFAPMCRSCHCRFDRFRDTQRPGFQGHQAAKLTADIVREARRLRAQGARVMDLAAAYGVAADTITRAINGKTWGWVT